MHFKDFFLNLKTFRIKNSQKEIRIRRNFRLIYHPTLNKLNILVLLIEPFFHIKDLTSQQIFIFMTLVCLCKNKRDFEKENRRKEKMYEKVTSQKILI